MKKLLIIASIIAMACSASAASFVWGFINEGEYENKSGAAFDSGTAFLFLGTVTATDTAFNLSSATYVTSAGYVNDYFGTQDTSNMPSSDIVTSTTAGQAYSLLLFETAGMTTADLTSYVGDYVLYVGSSTEGVLPGVSGNTYFADFHRDGEIGAANWATMSGGAVPEPTSGLLMLLGVAGLALRRHRA